MNIEELRRRVVAIQAGHDQIFEAFKDILRAAPPADHDEFCDAVAQSDSDTDIQALVKLAAIVGYWMTMDRIVNGIVETR